MRALIEDPEQLPMVLDDPSLIPGAVEEALRMFPAFAHFRRTATKDTELNGQQIKEGDKVVMWYVSSNRDETRYEDPDRFDVMRNPEHQAFGAGGRHFCLGTALARLELRILFEETLARYPGMERRDGRVRRVGLPQPAEDTAGPAGAVGVAVGDGVPTVYEWAGGQDAFERLTIAFYARVREDELLAPVFADVPDDHPHNVAVWLAEVFGGPSAYTEEHGGYHHMMTKRLGLAITEERRARWAQLIGIAADDAGCCPPTRSCARRSRPTSSGARASPLPTPNPAPSRRPRRRCHAGAGARRLRGRASLRLVAASKRSAGSCSIA